MVQPASVIVVDDHALFRMGVLQTIALSTNLRVVAEGASKQDAIDLAERHRPAVAILDISMPGGGIEAAREIHARWPDVRIVMLTVSEDDSQVLEALEAGAAGYILKGVAAGELLDALTTVQRGNSYLAPTLGSRLFATMRAVPAENANSPPDLSSKERQVLLCVARGMGNQAIADLVGTSVRNVKFHVSKLLRKMNAKNRVELALVAQRMTGSL
ncbi:response regulator transcription factor [Rhizobium sp. Root1220]|uniref:response regulator n=1 Tax=Rhizobium sp. Root1220 TaxID=1736432 RepID=UPI0006F2EEDD|nr:response regulator transcription factor [Rhizobium sp. Root1220]KQV84067.1 two-component system response regulator [Rhizobium sp. Root1220]